jgi:monoamine oxidase
MSPRFDTIVIGAGAAGLNAGCELQTAGQKVCIVEARSRVGGRIATSVSDGCVMELGAEFVHGRDPLLWALIKEARLATQEVKGSMLCATDKGVEQCGGAHDAAFDLLEKIDSKLSPEMSFQQYLDTTNASAEEREAATRFVEGFNAADARRISARSLAVQQRAEEEISGDRSWRVTGGYAQLAAHLERRFLDAGGHLQFDTVADEIMWQRGECVVRARQAREYIALKSSRVVMTVPLGVLQRRAIKFSPAPATLAAADRMAMGAAHRMALRFKTAFWKDGTGKRARVAKELERLSFLFVEQSDGGPFKVWWTPYPDTCPVLTGWCGGREAEAMSERLRAAHRADVLRSEAVEQLARIFEREAAWLTLQLTESQFHNWAEDEFACGAYSYVLAGELDAPFMMAAPVEDTLFFAGEHTDLRGHWGTVHAAVASGYRAARQILRGQE